MKKVLSFETVITTLNYPIVRKRNCIHRQVESVNIKYNQPERWEQEEFKELLLVTSKLSQLKRVQIDLVKCRKVLDTFTTKLLLRSLRIASEIVLKFLCAFDNKESFDLFFVKGLRTLNPDLKKLCIHTSLEKADRSTFDLLWKALKKYAFLEVLEVRLKLWRVTNFIQMTSSLINLKSLLSFTLDVSDHEKDLCPRITEDLSYALPYLRNLKHLDLKIPDSLSDPFPQITALFTSLLEMPFLESLAFRLLQPFLTSSEFQKSFCDNLKCLTQLKHFKFQMGRLVNETFEALCKCIGHLKLLINLDLQLFGAQIMNNEGLKRIILLLKTLKNLRKLDLEVRNILDSPLDLSELLGFIKDMDNIQEARLKLGACGLLIKRTGTTFEVLKIAVEEDVLQ